MRRKFVCRQDGHPEDDGPSSLQCGLWPRLGRVWQCKPRPSWLQWLRRRVPRRRRVRQLQPRHYRGHCDPILHQRQQRQRSGLSAVRRRVHCGAAERRVHRPVRRGDLLLPGGRRGVHPQRRNLPVPGLRHPLQSQQRSAVHGKQSAVLCGAARCWDDGMLRAAVRGVGDPRRQLRLFWWKRGKVPLRYALRGTPGLPRRRMHGAGRCYDGDDAAV